MADENGNKYSNVKYNRKRTWVEQELIKRGYKDRDIWVMVCPAYLEGKKYDKDQLDHIFNNGKYALGIQAIEAIAMCCNVSYMEVVDWVRLDMQPEKMTKTQFELYKRRIAELEAPDSVRWYLDRLCRKGFPVIQIIDAAAEGYEFKKEGYKEMKDWVWDNLISKGIAIDPSKKKPKKTVSDE